MVLSRSISWYVRSTRTRGWGSSGSCDLEVFSFLKKSCFTSSLVMLCELSFQMPVVFPGLSVKTLVKNVFKTSAWQR